ncbi:myosin [Trifolium repens]|nr:myosin [Trifolium repens]
MTREEFARRYGFLLYEANTSQDPLSVSVAVLQQFNIRPEMYQVGFTKLYLRTGQVGAFEDKRKLVLQGILGVQKCVCGHQARSHFNKLKNGVTILQSCNVWILILIYLCQKFPAGSSFYEIFSFLCIL